MIKFLCSLVVNKWTHRMQFLILSTFWSSSVMLRLQSFLGIGKVKTDVMVLSKGECGVLSLRRINQSWVALRREILTKVCMSWDTCTRRIWDSYIWSRVDDWVSVNAQKISILLWLISWFSTVSSNSLILNQTCCTSDLKRQINASIAFFLKKLIITNNQRILKLFQNNFWIHHISTFSCFL